MRMIGASAGASVVGVARRAGIVNHLVGRDPATWRTGLPTFAQVRVVEAYPGIDVVYYGTGGDLEYDFVIAPGARVESIALDLAGADALSIDARGDLVVRVGGAALVMRRPVVYQESPDGRRRIDGRYVLRPGRRVGFRVGVYDRQWPLVVDPVLAFSTYLGGSGSDASNEGLALDTAGNVYVAGETTSLNFPVANAVAPTPHGSTDAFVAKLAADGSTLLYATYLGGSGPDLARGIAVDAAGRAHVTGRTASTDFPTVNAMQSSLGGIGPNGVGDGFVVKLAADGSSLLYATYLGGTGDDVGRAIAVDGTGNAYVTGMTASSDFPSTAGAFQPSLAGVGADGDGDAFVVKLDPLGALVYGTYLGGTNSEIPRAIAVDASGRAHVTGRTFSSDFPTLDALQPQFGGVFDGFVTKLDATGSALVYSTFLGGQREDSGRGIALDATGHAYVTGFTASTDFPVLHPVQTTFAGGLGDAFVAKLAPDGSALIYSTYLGGSAWDEGFAIAVDSAGSAIVTGLTESTNFPRVAALQPGLAGSRDAFVTRLTAAGSALAWSTHLGGAGGEVGRGVAVTPAGDVWVTGETGSTDFPTALALQPTFGGGAFDAFVARLREPIAPAGPDLVITTVTRNLAVLAPGESLSVTDTVRNVGTQPAAKSRSRYYLSADLTRGGDILLTGLRSVVALAVSAQSRGSVSVAVPANTPPGDYVLFGCADDLAAVVETDEENNCTASASGVRVSRPDLAQQSVGPDKPTPTIQPGQRFKVKDTVRNPSAVKVPASKTRYYLSLNGERDASDRLLTGTRSVPALTAGKASTGSVTVTVPASMPAGTYRILACADDLGTMVESDETNNCAASSVTIAVVP